ncbi:MAG: hypothetical protein ACE15D_07750 [Candidatus Eisenbacteria bacterium]|nr:hypothetical protein [Candidatus Eisenbacteria bacterium]
MNRRRAIAQGACLLLAVLVPVIPAHAESGQPEAILLSSEPAGIGITLQGPVDLAGTTPLDLQDLPIGEYRLRSRESDLPAFRGRLVRGQQSLVQRPWAGVTSILFPPGVTHLERGEKRGWIFLGGAIASASMVLLQQSDLREAESEQDRFGREYETAVSEEDIQHARQSLETATQRAEDEEELRNLWGVYFGATAVGAFLEAVALTPEPSIDRLPEGGYLMRSPGTGTLRNALRSALVPGAGQRFAGEQGKANGFAIAIGALAALTIQTHADFLEHRRDQAEAQARFFAAETEQEIERTRSGLRRAQDRTDEAEILQWASVAALGVAYAWNVLDASASGSFAREDGRQSSGTPLAISWDPGARELRLAASWGGR